MRQGMAPSQRVRRRAAVSMVLAMVVCRSCCGRELLELELRHVGLSAACGLARPDAWRVLLVRHQKIIIASVTSSDALPSTPPARLPARTCFPASPARPPTQTCLSPPCLPVAPRARCRLSLYAPAPLRRAARESQAHCRPRQNVRSVRAVRANHTMPPLVNDITYQAEGINGVFTPEAYNIAWTQYQSHLVDNLNRLVVGDYPPPTAGAADAAANARSVAETEGQAPISTTRTWPTLPS